MKNALSLGNDFSTRPLGPLSSVPRPVSKPIVARENVERVSGRKASVLVVDFSRINSLVLVQYIEGN